MSSSETFTMPSSPENFTVPSRLSDAFRSHPVHLHHEHPDLAALQELPDSYAWTDQLEVYSAAAGDSAVSESVPVIDLSDPNALQLIGHACKTWGAFQVINHGLPPSLLDCAEYTSRDLFSLPLQQKLKASRSPDGVSGYGLSRSNSFFSKIMWSEGFTVLGSPLDHFRQLWPQDYTKHCDAIDEYEKEMKKLAERLMWLMLGSLGITQDNVNWADPLAISADGSSVLQMNYYPKCPDPDRAMGLAAHTDSTYLTIVYQNSTSGLQVLKKGTGWVTIPSIPGGLVINVGDLLDILSNGSYPSALHQAVVNRTEPRYSIAYFYGPPASFPVQPVHKLLGPSHPPLYRAITWSEYLGIKAKHFNQALSSIRICTLPNGLFDAKANDNSIKSSG